MAEEVETQEVETEDDFLKDIFTDDEEDYEEIEEEEERKVAKSDEKAERDLAARLDRIEKQAEQDQMDRLVDKFNEKADPLAKQWFAIMHTGNENPKQLRALMELAGQKAAEVAKQKGDTEETVEQAAEKLAADAWGVAPMKGGSSAGDHNAELLERIAQGDERAYLEATFVPPPRPRR